MTTRRNQSLPVSRTDLQALADPQTWAQVAEKYKKLEGLGDPAVKTLLQWEKTEESLENLWKLQRKLTPTHAYWLEKAATVPFGFFRLMLEVIRHECLEGVAEIKNFEQVRAYLRLGVLDRRARLDLEALALAYLADELREIGRHGEARRYMDEAFENLGVAADRELRVTIMQVNAGLLCEEGDEGRLEAERVLKRAIKILPRDQIPGRWSELFLVFGKLYLFDYATAKVALPKLRDALLFCPEDRALMTRYEVLHDLAVAQATLRHYESARNTLAEARHLKDYEDPERRGQRQWLEGYIALKTGHPFEAAKLFEKSCETLLDVGCWEDGARAFLDFAGACLVTDQLGKKHRKILRLHKRVAPTRELERENRKRWEELRDKLAEHDLELPELNKQIDRLKDKKPN